MPPSKMGRRIKTFRRASGLTQQQLAERARVTQSFVAKLENETGRSVSVATLQRLAKALGVTPGRLVD